MEATAIVPELIDAGVKTGNHTFIWVAVALFAMQMVIIPCIMFLYKHFNNKSEEKTKEIARLTEEKISAERELTGYKRDQQFKDMDSRWEKKFTEMETTLKDKQTMDNHAQEEMSFKMTKMAEVIEDTANKVNELYTHGMKLWLGQGN